MKAELLKQHRQRLPNGGLVEMKIWKLPCPVPPCDHIFKYRLVYILNGERLVGFDNEPGKGDHRYLDGKESVAALDAALAALPENLRPQRLAARE